MSLSARPSPVRTAAELRARTKSLAVSLESYAELLAEYVVDQKGDAAGVLTAIRMQQPIRFAGLPLVVDESVPPGMIDLRAASGRSLQLVRL